MVTHSDIKNLTKDLYVLEISQGTIYGQDYYCVRPVGYHWREPQVEWNEMIQWCIDTLGVCSYTNDSRPGVWEPDQRWYVNGTRFWFKDEADRTMFVLRFS